MSMSSVEGQKKTKVGGCDEKKEKRDEAGRKKREK